MEVKPRGLEPVPTRGAGAAGEGIACYTTSLAPQSGFKIKTQRSIIEIEAY